MFVSFDFSALLRNKDRLKYSVFDINFSLILPRDLDINGLERQTGRRQHDPIRIPFLPFEVRNPKNDDKNYLHFLLVGGVFNAIYLKYTIYFEYINIAILIHEQPVIKIPN